MGWATVSDGVGGDSGGGDAGPAPFPFFHDCQSSQPPPSPRGLCPEKQDLHPSRMSAGARLRRPKSRPRAPLRPRAGAAREPRPRLLRPASPPPPPQGSARLGPPYRTPCCPAPAPARSLTQRWAWSARRPETKAERSGFPSRGCWRPGGGWGGWRGGGADSRERQRRSPGEGPVASATRRNRPNPSPPPGPPPSWGADLP